MSACPVLSGGPCFFLILARRWIRLAGGTGMVLWLAAGCVHPGREPDSSALLPVGLARVDITPPRAVPLMGYAARAQLPAPTNAAQRIHARALAAGSGADAAVLLTVDNCILPGALTEQLRSRLRQRFGLAPER
ncbi:MAG: hypothetical protein ACKOET_12495, partial [Verrucomicrobiota bacterium]